MNIVVTFSHYFHVTLDVLEECCVAKNMAAETSDCSTMVLKPPEKTLSAPSPLTNIRIYHGGTGAMFSLWHEDYLLLDCCGSDSLYHENQAGKRIQRLPTPHGVAPLPFRPNTWVHEECFNHWHIHRVDWCVTEETLLTDWVYFIRKYLLIEDTRSPNHN